MSSAASNITIPLPTQSGNVTYNGSAQSPTWTNYDPIQITMTGETSATDAGTHTVTCVPNGRCFWADGTQDPKTTTWTIGKAAGSVTLSANSGTVTYGTPATFSVTSATGNLSVQSSNPTYVTASISGTTVTLNTLKYSSSPIAVTVSAAESANYFAASTTYTVTTARATPTFSISGNSATLTVAEPTATITVTTNSNGAISAISSDASICNTSVSGTTVTLTGNAAGSTTVTISVLQSDQYASASDTVSVNVPTAVPLNLLANRTLAELQTIIQNGNAASYFKPGDYFDFTMASAVTLDSGDTIAANSTWRAYILGIDHNSTLEGTNRVHFCIGRNTDNVEIAFADHRMNSTNTNSGGWNGSTMKTFLNGTFYNALPTDLKNVITECDKWTNNSGQNDTSGAVTSTSQKIWLLSEFEVFGARTYANQYEQNKQSQYDYYKNGNSSARCEHVRGKNLNEWWLRSPCYDKASSFCYTSLFGNLTRENANEKNGVVPCFTIS